MNKLPTLLGSISELISFTISSSGLFAQELVKDINSEIEPSSVGNLFNANGQLYFSSNFDQNGVELWQTTSALDSANIVKDINPAFLDANPIPYLYHEGLLYFGVYRSGFDELWISDGTELGTVFIKTVKVNSMTTINGKILFSGQTQSDGKELWITDGTEAGTHILKDILAGPQSTNPSSFTVIGQTLYFAAADTLHGEELWKSDGTEAGTQLVKDLNTGSDFSSPSNFIKLNDKLYFTCYQPETGIELWASDGTEAGTTLVKDINPMGGFGLPNHLTVIENTLFFLASDGVSGSEIWKSDGTEIGTILVKDLAVGIAPANITELVDFNQTLYFTFYDNTSGHQLWKSNGTDEGTFKVFDIHSGLLNNEEYIGNLTTKGDQLFFVGNDIEHGKELWVLNTGIQPPHLLDINPNGSSNPSNLTIVDDQLVFTTQIDKEISLWKTDGTFPNTKIIYTAPIKTASSNIREIYSFFGDKLIFNAQDENGNELWISDGTSEGTHILKDIDTLGSSNPKQFTSLGNIIGDNLVFVASTPETGEELWKTDGTQAGTQMIKDIKPGEQAATINSMKTLPTLVSEDYIVFVANDGNTGKELWTTNGTESGTLLVKDIRPDNSSSSPKDLTVMGGMVFFSAVGPGTGKELWRSNGTEMETQIVKDIKTGTSSSYPRNLHAVNNTLYFTAKDNDYGTELWKTDGTDEGTLMVKDILLGTESSRPNNLTHIGDQLYFTTNLSDTTFLWTSNGTDEGTKIVVTFSNITTNIQGLSTVNNKLFFLVNKANTGNELWISDGSRAGTHIIKDINPGVNSSFASIPVFLKNKYYFTANDGIHGGELWETDGSSENTKMVKDINKGAKGSFPKNLVVQNQETLFFIADDGFIGKELWKYVPIDDCISAVAPELTTSTTQICSGETATINIASSSNLNGATKWFLYSKSCGEILEDSTASLSFEVMPSETTDYYIRGEGGCTTPGVCTPITISIFNTVDTIFIEKTACGSYEYNGETYTESGNYFNTFPNANGCDSASLLSLTIISIDDSIALTDATLSVSEQNAQYQWISCDDNANIENANGATYTATETGNYACVITLGECTDTTSCEMVTIISNQDLENKNHKIYPNPTSGNLFLDLSNIHSEVKISLIDVLGKIVFNSTEYNNQIIVISNESRNGIYFLRLEYEGDVYLERVVFE